MNNVPRHPSQPNDPAIAATDRALDWIRLEEIVHHDPGGRGLASFRRHAVPGAKLQPLDAGQLRAASLDLAQHASAVAILTGFCVSLPDRVTAETDGPPGALYLAQALSELGVEVAIVTDHSAIGILKAGARLVGLSPACVHECPSQALGASSDQIDLWVNDFLSRGGAGVWSHLIAIERPGPSHTPDTLVDQKRRGEAPLARFLAETDPADYGLCHTMRGVSIEQHTAPTHRLFEAIIAQQLPITTIGIGDGGNELGLGCYAWEDLVAALGPGPGGRIACRVAADFGLLAGTSNWGGYALALAVALLRGQSLSARWFTPSGQAELVAELVAAGAVDGRTRVSQPTVDGLSLEAYLAPLSEMLAWAKSSAANLPQ